MKKRVAFIVYRAWAYDIYKHVLYFQKQYPDFEIAALITTPEHEFDIEQTNIPTYIVKGNDQVEIDRILFESHTDVAFFYGWSWMVKELILSKYTCLCLHPSPLPAYRGGSPIQNQIIDGKTESAVSVFKMSEGIDDGDIYQQAPMSLAGSLNEIFSRITDIGTDITQKFIKDSVAGTVLFVPQKFLEKYPPIKRRTKEQSKLILENVASMPYIQLYNIVRALTDPYPNAYVELNGGILLIQEVQFQQTLSPHASVLNEGAEQAFPQNNQQLYFRVQDGYAQVIAYKIQ